MANRNPSPARRFQPGRSGNPRGRAPDPLSKAVRTKLTPEDAEQIAETVISFAKAGNLRAVAMLWDRLEGKAVARTETGEPGEFGLSMADARRVLQLGSYRDPSRDAG